MLTDEATFAEGLNPLLAARDEVLGHLNHTGSNLSALARLMGKPDDPILLDYTIRRAIEILVDSYASAAIDINLALSTDYADGERRH